MTLGNVNWRLIRFRPTIFGVSVILQIFRLGLIMAPGLMLRAIFDRLAIDSPLGWGFWGLIAAIMAIAVARAVALLTGVAVELTGNFIAASLLRTNPFEHLLRRSDARAQAIPTGEIINRLNHDTAARVARAPRIIGPGWRTGYTATASPHSLSPDCT